VSTHEFAHISMVLRSRIALNCITPLHRQLTHVLRLRYQHVRLHSAPVFKSCATLLLKPAELRRFGHACAFATESTVTGDNTTRKGQKYIPVDRRARKAKALLATDRILKQLQLPDGTFVTEPKPGLKSLRSRLESFLAAGNHGGLSAEERADRVLEVLQLLLQLGCTLPAIARQAKPPFLRKPVSILEERLDWFVDIAGFSRSEAAAVVLREAYVLRIPMSTLKSAHAFLTDAGLSAEQFSRMLRRQGCQILAMSEPLLAQKLAVFDDLGYSRKDSLGLLTRAPRAMCLSTQNIREKHHLWAETCTVSLEEVRGMFLRSPTNMTICIDSDLGRLKLQLFDQVLGRPRTELTRGGAYIFQRSLSVIARRFCYMQHLGRKIPTNIATLVNPSHQNFLMIWAKSNEDDYEEWLEGWLKTEVGQTFGVEKHSPSNSPEPQLG